MHLKTIQQNLRVPEPSGNKGVRKSGNFRNSDIMLTSRFDAVLYIFHKECAAMITMKHKLAYVEALCY